MTFRLGVILRRHVYYNSFIHIFFYNTYSVLSMDNFEMAQATRNGTGKAAKNNIG